MSDKLKNKDTGEAKTTEAIVEDIISGKGKTLMEHVVNDATLQIKKDLERDRKSYTDQLDGLQNSRNTAWLIVGFVFGGLVSFFVFHLSHNKDYIEKTIAANEGKYLKEIYKRDFDDYMKDDKKGNNEKVFKIGKDLPKNDNDKAK